MRFQISSDSGSQASRSYLGVSNSVSPLIAAIKNKHVFVLSASAVVNNDASPTEILNFWGEIYASLSVPVIPVYNGLNGVSGGTPSLRFTSQNPVLAFPYGFYLGFNITTLNINLIATDVSITTYRFRYSIELWAEGE